MQNEVAEHIKWYRDHRAQIAAVVIFIIGALGGNTDRIYNSLPDWPDNRFTLIDEQIEDLEIRIQKLEPSLPNQDLIKENHPTIERLDLSILKDN